MENYEELVEEINNSGLEISIRNKLEIVVIEMVIKSGESDSDNAISITQTDIDLG